MGCESSRDHHPEDTIESNEKLLGIDKLTVSQVLQAFFNLNSKEEIEEKKVRKALEVLNVHLSEEDTKNYLNPFLGLFEITSPEKDPESPKIYNFPAMVTTMIIMSKSKTTEKAKAIFRVWDHECKGTLSRETAQHILKTIFEEVRRYSELFSELDSFKIAAQATKVTDSINILVGHRLNILIGDDESLTEEHFISRFGRLDKSEEEPALAPSEIRKAIMPYVFEKTASLKNN